MMAYKVIFASLLLFHCTVVFGAVSFVMVPFATNNNGNVKVSFEVQTHYSVPLSELSVNIGQRLEPDQNGVYQFDVEPDDHLIPGNVTQSAVYINIEHDNIQQNLIALRLMIDDLEPVTIYPIESLGNEYRVITYCQILGSCFLALSTVPNTGLVRVNVILPRENSMEVQYHKTSYNEGQQIQIQLLDNETLLLECKQCDFTGTLIKSSEKIAVFAGGIDTIVRRGDVESTFLAQMTPVHTWGKDFILVDSNIDDMGDMIRIVPRYRETVVKVSGQTITRINSTEHYIQGALNRGDIVHVTANKPIMICQILTTGSKQGLMLNVPPTEQYFEYNFNTHCRYNGFAIISGDEDVTIHSEPRIIGNSGYIATKVDSNSCQSLNLVYKHVTIFGQRDHAGTPYIKDTLYFSQPFLREVLVNKTMVPGDKADNDNDGQIDEDDCGFYLSSKKANFNTAITECEKLNKSLAIIDTEERYLMTKEFLKDKEVSETYAYIGLKRSSGNIFQLLDNTSFNLQHWASGQPDKPAEQECVVITIDGAKLHDAICLGEFNFLCTEWIRDENDDCPPEIYGEKDSHGLHFVFPVWHLDGATQFQVDIFGDETDVNGEIINYSNGTNPETATLAGVYGPHTVKDQPVMQVIRIKSYSEVSASLIMWKGSKAVSTLLYPVDMWGLEYHAASYCPNDCTSYCFITSAYSNTNVKIVFKTNNFTATIIKLDGSIIETNKLFINLKIEEYTYAKIESAEDLTGTYIKADNPISVICGSTFENSEIAEQIIPVQFYQTGLFTNIFQLYDTRHTYRVRIMGSEQFTVCEVRSNGKENFAHLVFIKAAGDFYELQKSSYDSVESISCNLPVFVWSVIFKDTEISLMIINPSNEQTANRYIWKSVGNLPLDLYGFSTKALEVSFTIENDQGGPSHTMQLSQDVPLKGLLTDTRYSVTSDDDFFLWFVNIIDDAIGTSIGMKFNEQEVCTLHNLEDPDCDGLTKEEICTVKGYNFIPEKYLLQNNTFIPDYDLDGNYDEDCAFTLPECYTPNIIHGSANSDQTYVTSKITDLSCHDSFTPASTVDEITCYANGSWAPEFICQRDCSDQEFSNSKAVHNSSFAIGTTVTMECIEGYTLKGDNNITCLENSTWGSIKFECLADCGDPSDDYTNSAILVNSSWAVNSTIEMDCQEGFALIGEKTLKCHENSTWTQNAFFCKEDCGDPSDDYTNSAILVNSSWAVNSTIEMDCQEGFALIGEKTLKCHENSTWTQNAFFCKEDCGDPSDDYTNSAILVNSSWAVNSTIEMDCQEGFALIGGKTLKCHENSTWTQNAFFCKEDCGDPSDDYTNSAILVNSSWAVNSTIEMDCQEGFALIGEKTLKCHENSTWTQNAFFCKEDCGDPSDDYTNSAILVNSSWAVNSTIEMDCQEGFALIGEKTLKCHENSTWTQNAFFCKEDCGDPRDDYNNSAILVNSSWAVNSTIEMDCQEGFALIGEKTLKCHENSTWTQNAFSCKEGCDDPSAFVKYSALHDPLKPREHGSSHKMICTDGYSVKGNASMTCLDDSTWTSPKFSCVEGCNDPRLSTEHSYIEDYKEGTPFLPDMTIIMKCKRHSTKLGIGKMTCLDNKQWTRNISCIKDCPDPRTFFSIPLAMVRGFTDESSRAYGVTYDFRCRLFYTLYGDGRIECLKNSSWNNVNISCKTCKCPCRRRGNPRHDNVTKETYKEIADETKKEIAVDKKATAVSFRRKNSATDERPEARNIGAVGIVMLSVVLGAIVLADLLSLKIYIQNYLRRASGQ